MDYTLEKMRDADWAAVCAIYLEGIATGNATFETESPDWEDWHSHHLPQPTLWLKLAAHVRMCQASEA